MVVYLQLFAYLLMSLWWSVLTSADAPLAITDAALAEHRDVLRLRLTDEYTAQVQAPFVVISNFNDADIQRRAMHLVDWASGLLEQDFFAAPPDAIYDLWLFKDAESYTRTVTHLTGAAPISPYGFCSDATKSIYLNYATGGGTLIHEMTHAYMHGNFRACPAWFNEGLASLFEAVQERDGHLHGLPNWRLNGLQRALKAGSAPGFATLMATTSARFYGEESAVNYGVARYLCYHLQERGLLIPFYRAFLANQADDHSGLASLIQVLGSDKLTDFRTEWEAMIMALELPGR